MSLENIILELKVFFHFKLSNKQISIIFVNRQLKPYKLTYRNVITIDNWFSIYTISEEKLDKLTKFIISLIKRQKRYKMFNDKYIQNTVSMLVLNYGLRTEKKQINE